MKLEIKAKPYENVHEGASCDEKHEIQRDQLLVGSNHIEQQQ